MWNVFFFETTRSNSPVEEYIDSLPKNTVSKVSREIDLLKTYGNDLRMPHSKQLTNNLYELRIRGQIELRILYCFKNSKIYLIHIFKKETDKTPKKELNIGLSRKESILLDHNL